MPDAFKAEVEDKHTGLKGLYTEKHAGGRAGKPAPFLYGRVFPPWPVAGCARHPGTG